MIPVTDEIMDEDVEIVEMPSKTYKLNTDTDKVQGMCDELDAMRQAILKALGTERYDYVIYSWDYGVEFTDLIGKSVMYAVPEIKRRIEDALSVDDRIFSCDNFQFDTSQKGIVAVSFTVSTTFGNVDIESEVNI